MSKGSHGRGSDPEDPYAVTQASRIYFLPNLMTAGNLFCGFMAILQCVQARLAETSIVGEYAGATNAEHYRYAVWFIFAAAGFDALDGRLARMGGRESLFGAEFDSIADVISFGMAPALLMIYLIISPTQAQDYEWFRNIGWFIAFVYLLCAAMRLARFNVITNPYIHPGSKESHKDFVGLPVPAAASTVAATVLFILKLGEMDRSLKSWALALPPLMLLIAILMMSRVRYPRKEPQHADADQAAPVRRHARGGRPGRLLQGVRRLGHLRRLHLLRAHPSLPPPTGDQIRVSNPRVHSEQLFPCE